MTKQGRRRKGKTFLKENVSFIDCGDKRRRKRGRMRPEARRFLLRDVLRGRFSPSSAREGGKKVAVDHPPLSIPVTVGKERTRYERCQGRKEKKKKR